MERLPKRNEVPVELTWRLSDIYPSTDAWEKDFKESLDLAEKIAGFEGRVSDIYPSTDAWEKDFKESLDLAEKIAGFEGRAAADAKSLLAVMDLYEACMIKFYAVIHYANLLHDEDTADQAHQVLIQRAQSAGVQISEKIAYLEPEILELPDDKLTSYYEAEPGLEKYRVTISEIVRLRDHSLSKEMEKLLASAGDMAETPSKGFSMLNNADLKFPTVVSSDGEEIQLTGGRFYPRRCRGTENCEERHLKSSTRNIRNSSTLPRPSTTDR